MRGFNENFGQKNNNKKRKWNKNFYTRQEEPLAVSFLSLFYLIFKFPSAFCCWCVFKGHVNLLVCVCLFFFVCWRGAWMVCCSAAHRQPAAADDVKMSRWNYKYPNTGNNSHHFEICDDDGSGQDATRPQGESGGEEFSRFHGRRVYVQPFANLRGK